MRGEKIDNIVGKDNRDYDDHGEITIANTRPKSMDVRKMGVCH